MRKPFYTLLAATAMLFVGCEQVNLDDINSRIDGIEERLATLEELCAQMNTNITSLQTIVAALQNNDYITSVENVYAADQKTIIGYRIAFTKSAPIVIYHGEKGEAGEKGDTGEAGHNPVVGVKMDTDGIYYWTIDGRWLTDASGNKIKAVGTDGTNGTDGKDGENGSDGKDAVAPQLKIEGDHWWLSTDGGKSWTDLGQAKGDAGKDGKDGQDGENGKDGKDGEDGDSFFRSVVETEAAVVFTLADGTVITIPKSQSFGLVFTETDGIGIAAGQTVEIDFAILGGAAETRVGTITSDGWRASIAKGEDNVSGKLTVTAPNPFVASAVSVWVSNSERTLFYSISFERGVVNVTSSTVYNLTFDAQTFDVTVETNVDYTIEISDGADWLTKLETRALRTETTTFSVTANEEGSREAQIVFKTADGITLAAITVSQSIYIVFADAAVNAICLANFDTDGNGEISYAEAAAVTDIGKLFQGPSIVSFNELQYFTSLTSIGYGAFYGCRSLTSITIPDSVTSIGSSAFYDCRSLTSITIPDGVTSIGDAAFLGCWSLTSITIPDGVTSIGNQAFFDCSSLTSITIPDGVTSIGGSAFYDCRSLTSITIPDGVTSIGYGAFCYCSSLERFDGQWASNDNRCLVVNGELVAFAPAGLTEYTIPDGVTSIGYGAFLGCSSLTSITIPNSVTSIERGAFNGCGSLTSITIPESVTSIGNYAFYYCSSLTSITIPDGVTSIGDAAFYGCSSLASVYCKPTTPPTLDYYGVFYENAEGRKIYVPTGSVDAYKAANRWSSYAADIVGYDF